MRLEGWAASSFETRAFCALLRMRRISYSIPFTLALFTPSARMRLSISE
jgi:hypothetical protein